MGPESKDDMILCGLGEKDEITLAAFRRSDIVML